MSKSRGLPLLIGLVFGSLIVATYEVAHYCKGSVPTNPFSAYWPVIFSILLALWIEGDSRGRATIYRPFEFSFLIYFWSVFYAPYYLWRTRGARGLFASLGLVVLPVLGTVVGMGL